MLHEKNLVLVRIPRRGLGGSFVAIKYAVEDFPTELAVLLRMLAGSFSSAPLVLQQKCVLPSLEAPRPSPSKWDFSFGLPFLLLFWAETKVGPA